jgi:hypothetical protein
VFDRRYDLLTKTLVPAASAALEMATGIALIASPAFVIQLLIGAQLSTGGVAVGRVCGIGLLALGLASLPRRNVETRGTTALLVYNLLAFLYFGYLGGSGQFTGRLLWPACFIHGLFALLLAVSIYRDFRRQQY